MKLKNKLIPFGIAVCSTAVITPLAFTSCANANNNGGSLTMSEVTADNAKPTFTPRESTLDFTTQEEATKEYIDFVKANPQYFVDDLRWGMYQNWLSFYDNSYFNYSSAPTEFQVYFNPTLTKLEFAATTPKFGTATIEPRGSEPVTYPTVSFKMKTRVEAKVVSKEYGSYLASTKDIVAETEVEYKNMIFFAYRSTRDDKTRGYAKDPAMMKFDTTKSSWFITISDNMPSQSIYQNYFGDWSIKYKSDIKIVNTVQDLQSKSESTTTSEGVYSNTIREFNSLDSLVNMKSYTDNRDYYYENWNDFFYDIYDDGEFNAWYSWFTQKPEAIIANAVLMDTVTHYFSNVIARPRLISMNPYLSLNRFHTLGAFDDPSLLDDVEVNTYGTEGYISEGLAGLGVLASNQYGNEEVDWDILDINLFFLKRDRTMLNELPQLPYIWQAAKQGNIALPFYPEGYSDSTVQSENLVRVLNIPYVKGKGVAIEADWSGWSDPESGRTTVNGGIAPAYIQGVTFSKGLYYDGETAALAYLDRGDNYFTRDVISSEVSRFIPILMEACKRQGIDVNPEVLGYKITFTRDGETEAKDIDPVESYIPFPRQVLIGRSGTVRY